jgi:ATP-dependent DNA ligase
VRAVVDPDRVILHSRRGRPLDPYFPEITAALASHLPAGTVVDGELVVYDADRGRTWFPLLNRRITAGRNLPQEVRQHPASYVVFDQLQYADEDLTTLPYAQRRPQLETVMAGAPAALTVCPTTNDPAQAREWMADAADLGIEGIVVKDMADPYRPGRTRWRKVKTRTTTEAIIGGLTGPISAPTSLLLGRYDTSGRLRYAGFTTRLTPPRASS